MKPTLEQQIYEAWINWCGPDLADHTKKFSSTEFLTRINHNWQDTQAIDSKLKKLIEALIKAAPLAERLTSPYAFIRNTGVKR